MFDVGFWELAMIMVVALLVIGPERLPKVARTLGLWLGRARSAFNSVKADIDRELRAEELKSMLAKQVEAPELERFRQELGRDVGTGTPAGKPAMPPASAPGGGEPAKPAGDERS